MDSFCSVLIQCRFLRLTYFTLLFCLTPDWISTCIKNIYNFDSVFVYMVSDDVYFLNDLKMKINHCDSAPILK